MKALEKARGDKRINKSQEASVALTVPADKFAAVTAFDSAVYEELFIVFGVSFTEGEEFEAVVNPAEGEKCPRCWNYRELTGNQNHAGVCARCADALDAIGFAEE